MPPAGATWLQDNSDEWHQITRTCLDESLELCPSLFVSFKIKNVSGIYFQHLEYYDEREIYTILFGASDAEYREVINKILDEEHQTEVEEAKEAGDTREWDNTILDEGTKEEIDTKFKIFLDSKDMYADELRVPWKMGMVFIGPPGNGKTRSIRAICKKYGLRLSSISEYITPNGLNLPKAIDEGSSTGLIPIIEINIWAKLYDAKYPESPKPTVIAAEDLDKTLYGSGRDAATIRLSDFLNQVDGISSTHGIILIATTNHPGDLPEAIFGRPGRFDHVWEFNKPGKEQLQKYFESRNFTVKGETDLAEVVSENEMSMAFAEALIISAKTTYKKNEFTDEEILPLIQRLKDHQELAKKYCADIEKRQKDGFGFSN